jgi:Tol biopolymer transport system component/DNA-binding winged helix-turn-helix (wHTH) protein
MKLGATAGEIVRFGIFEVDLETGELRRNGLKLKLQEQPFEILRALLERPGEIVTREELRQRLWPSDTFVDFDHSLNTAVNKLRNALGDSAQNPRFIVTVPRRGLRFIAPVETIERKIEAVAPPVRRTPLRRWLAVAAGAFAFAIAIGALWTGAARQPVVFEAVPLSTLPGHNFDATFSPSGAEVAFRWSGPDENNWDIYVKQIGVETPVRFTDHSAVDLSPAWSPDGQWIAYARLLESGTLQYFVKPHRGGPERKLAEFGVFNTEPCWPCRLVAWHPGSRHLAVTGKSADGEPASLFLIPLEGEGMTRLTQPPGRGADDISPAFSPDGRMLAFERLRGWVMNSIFLLDIAGDGTPVGDPRQLTGSSESASQPAWMPNSRELVYQCLSPASGSGLCRIRADGALQSRIPGIKEAACPAISRTGVLAYCTLQIGGAALWRISLDEGGRMSGGPREIRSSTRMEQMGAFSPDGKRITFESERSGSREIWIADSDGSNPIQLTSLSSTAQGPRWSPDGASIAFTLVEGQQRDIYVIGVSSREVRRLTSDPADDSGPRWSRDGRWIYFGSNRTGSYEAWKIPAAGGAAIQVTRNGGGGAVEGWAAVESWDGAHLYFRKPSGCKSSLWRMPIEGGPEEKVLDDLNRSAGAVVGRNGIYFSQSDKPCGQLRGRGKHSGSSTSVPAG